MVSVTPRPHSVATGWRFVTSGLVVLLGYAALAWTAVYGNDEAEQPCSGPHRDYFFPPRTVCGTGPETVTITSSSTIVAASLVLLLGVGLLATGVVLLVRRRRSARMA
jgi:Zn-dependent protease with chaperone function